MTLSIVNAVYSRADTIADALRSLQEQSPRDVEPTILDGGSTDGTLGMVERLADSRTPLESALDGGFYEALNREIAWATGDDMGYSIPTTCSPMRRF